MLWEYLVVDLTPADDWTAILNTHAGRGWELINVSLNTTLTHDDGSLWNTHKAIISRLSARGGARS